MKEYIYKKLLSYGLFSEYLPINFNTEDLAKNLEEIRNYETFNSIRK